MLKNIKKTLREINTWIKINLFSKLNTEDKELISKIHLKRLTYLSIKKLSQIATQCHSIEQSKLPGLFIEAGCALGGSSILIASIKNNDRVQLVYDVFGMIPPPTKEDTEDVHGRYKTIVEGKSEGIAGDEYYGYKENLIEVVNTNFKDFGIDCKSQNVQLIKGLVQDTMNIDKPVAFAHIDVDWYEPVKVCLERIWPNLISKGVIILDDYHDWGGCRKAVDEFLRNIIGQFDLDDSAGSMMITKK